MSGRHSQTILGPAGVIQDMCLDDTDKGREAFSKIKRFLRQIGPRTRRALVEAIGEALDAVTARDARDFFEHCGYRRLSQLLCRASSGHIRAPTRPAYARSGPVEPLPDDPTRSPCGLSDEPVRGPGAFGGIDQPLAW